MASSYSDLGLELMVTGENAGTWGDKTNSNLNLIQQSVAGYEAVALSDGGIVTLAMTDAQLSNARNMVIKFTGTLTSASTVTIPDGIEKFYIFDCSAVVGPTNLTIKTVSGTGFTLNAAKIFAAYSDGTNLNEISLDTLGGSIAAADITGTISTSQIADNAVTTAKISDNQITTAKISDNQITTAKISDNQITTAKIANDAVGPDQLSDTAVTAGSYDLATITVDAQGRITSASAGAAGGGINQAVSATGPASGVLTADAASTELLIYAASGGGGGGGAAPRTNANNGGSGGEGLFGYYEAPISAPFSQPWSVGGAGTAGTPGNYTGGNGGTGGTVSLTNIFNINGGNGGQGGQIYNPNGAPGNIGSASATHLIDTVNYGNPYRIVGENAGRAGGASGEGSAAALVIYER
jgi:hypothetical protein